MRNLILRSVLIVTCAAAQVNAESPTSSPASDPFLTAPAANQTFTLPAPPPVPQPAELTAGFLSPPDDAFATRADAELTSAITELPDVDESGVSLPRLASLERNVNNLLQSATGVTYPSIKINGVFQTDTGWVNQSDASLARYGKIKDGTDFRRARLAASGAVTEVNNYFLQMDFAFFGRPTFTDLWVEQTDLPILGNVRVGQWKQPFSLEVVSSFRYTTFAERSVLFQPFTPFRHIGIGFYNRNQDQTVTWAASAFAAGQDQFGGSIANSGGIGTAERLTWLSYYDEASGGRYYMHHGLGHYFSRPNDHATNFRTIPELYIGQFNSAQSGPNQQPTPTTTTGMPFFIATGNLSLRNYNVLGSELLWVRGPWSLQTESMGNFVNQLSGENLFFFGGYAQAGYFLTGEHRPYDRKTGAIDRIKPFENFFRVRSKEGGVCRGWGAWEVAARVSTINLKGHYVGGHSAAFPTDLTNGGVLTDYTAGLNWYLNAYTKCQFNYIYSRASNSTGGVALNNLFDVRFQVDF